LRFPKYSYAALALLLGVVACGDSNLAQAQTRAAEQQRTNPAVASAIAVDTSAAYALSAAFRAASERALPAVVYVNVERDPRVVRGRGQQQLPENIPEPFRRFFQLPVDPGDDFQMPPEEGTGSGFIIDAAGHVVTNHHVVADAQRIQVRLQDGREFDAKLIGSDANTDVALVKIESGNGRLPTLPFGDSENLRVGDWVLALGNPLGFDFTVTAGIVSAKGRRNFGTSPYQLESFIQTDAAINPGNSGGPLVDLAGRVVGMNTLIAGGGSRFVGYGFAVPSSLVQRVVADLKEYGRVHRPRLGVRVGDVNAVDAEVYGLTSIAGAEIVSVEENTPGQRAGLRAGDVVLTLDGQPIRNGNDLTIGLARRKPGDRVTLGIWRDKRRQEISVTLGEFEEDRPANNARPDAGRTTAEERLGFRVEPLTPQLANQLGYRQRSGLVISSLTPGSQAGGVRQGSLLLSINGQAVSTAADVARIAQNIRPGSAISLRVINPELGEMVVNYRAGR
jgi:serine protease Do